MSDTPTSRTSWKAPLVKKLIQWVLGGGSTLGLLALVGMMVKDVAIDTIDQVSANQSSIVQMQISINALEREDKLLWNTVSPTVQNYDKVNAQVSLLMDMYKQQHGVRPVVVLMNPETGAVNSFKPPAAADDDDNDDSGADDERIRGEKGERPLPGVLKHLDDIEKAKHRKTPNQFRKERMKIQQTTEDLLPQAQEEEK